MASLFGNDGVEDLFNENIEETDQLPSDDDVENQHNENIFGAEDNEVEEDAAGKPIKVEPKKRAVRNPRPRLTIETLQGPRGIQTIEEYFKDIKFGGKGHEKKDLDQIMHRLQHWGHRMYPNYKFDDVLNNIERLSKKKMLHVFMNRYRLGLLQTVRNDVEIHDEYDNENDLGADEPFDEFDALLGEQIAISNLAPRTPAANSRATHTPMSVSTVTTTSFARGNAVMSTPYAGIHQNLDESELAVPLPPSPIKSQPAPPSLTEDELARIAENRRIAKERLEATRMRKQQKQN